MKQIGSVLRVNIFEDRNRKSKGCGYFNFECNQFLRVVEFETKEDALKAIKELHESVLDGRNIYLREVKPHVGGN